MTARRPQFRITLSHQRHLNILAAAEGETVIEARSMKTNTLTLELFQLPGDRVFILAGVVPGADGGHGMAIPK